MDPRQRLMCGGAALLGALLFLLVALLVRGSGATPVPAVGPTVGPTMGDVPETAADTATPLSAGSARDGALEPVARADAGRLVRVVDAAGGPAVGAEVAWTVLPLGESPSLRAHERRAWHGEVRTADEDGCVRLPGSAAPTIVFARRGAEWGSLRVEGDTAAPVGLQLQPDRNVRLQVLDDAGRPLAGPTVSLRGKGGEVGIGGDFAAAATGPRAIAEFPHAQALLPPGWNGRCDAVLDVALAEPVSAAIDLRALPELVRLRLPAAASLHVRLVTDAGPFEPLVASPAAMFFFASRGDASAEHRLRVEFPRGELHLAHVGLGLRCRMVLDGAEGAGAIEFDGPTAVGERLEVDLHVVPMPVLTGRMVDVARQPLRGLFDLQQVQDTPGWLLQQFETGADGRFLLRLAEPPLPGEESGLLFHRPRDEIAGQAFVVVKRSELHNGRNDLGDVVLAPVPLLVGGRVVDQRGKGVPGARLRILRTRDDTSWGLESVSRQDPHTEPDGTFAVHAHALVRDLRLLAFTAGRAGEELPFLPPAPNLTYVLPAVGALSATVRCRGGVRPDDLWFALRERTNGTWLGRASAHVLDGETFRWSGLLPGRYDLQVTNAGGATPLWQARDVAVEPDEVTALPTVLLGEGVPTVAVRVVDPAGQPVGGAWAIVDPEDAAVPRTALRSRDGVFALPLPRAPVDLLVEAPGFRAARALGVTGDLTMRLEPGHSVLLHADVSPPLPADQRLVPHVRRVTPEPAADLDLRLDHHVLAFTPGHDERLWQQELALDRGGHVRLQVPGPGDYEVVWWLDAYRDLAPIPGAHHRFTVADGAAVTTVDVAVALPVRDR